MPLNDGGNYYPDVSPDLFPDLQEKDDGEEYANELQDEYTFDAHYPPGVEIGAGVDEGVYEVDHDQPPLDIQRDCGSGSFAEDGQQEVAEDRTMGNGEAQIGSYAMFGPTEIGNEFEESDHFNEATEIGNGGYVAKYGPSEIGNGGYIAKYGPSEIGNGGYIAKYGPSEIGAVADLDASTALLGAASVASPFESFMLSPTRIGAAAAADRPGTEIGDWYPGEGYSAPLSQLGAGHYPTDGASELGAGHYPTDGASELGSSWAPQEGEFGFVGSSWQPQEGEGGFIGAGHYPTEGASEIGAKAVAKVIEKARDNRAPAPQMKAVNIDEIDDGEEEDFLSEVVLGAAVALGRDVFPLTAKLLQLAGAATEPRIVRIDTEASYKEFRQESSPELAELKERLEAHMADPNAHGRRDLEDNDDGGFSDDLSEDIDDLVHLGAEVDAAEEAKRVELWMPKRFDGKLEAWREGDFVCASIALPGQDGEVRICTSLEPIRKCVEEMSRHAAESGVPASSVVGAIPKMGCVLGAGTAIKEMAAAAPAILSRPEAAIKMPFMVRIEPKTNPSLAALAMLAEQCRLGNTTAQDEWKRLGKSSPSVVRQAMAEALEIAKAAA